MSWDIVFSLPEETLGTKEQARESFLSACEQIIGHEVPRRGPTDVDVHPSFRYETYFIGHKRAVESLTLSIHVIDGDPHASYEHPVWTFLQKLRELTGWEAFDTHTGKAVPS